MPFIDVNFRKLPSLRARIGAHFSLLNAFSMKEHRPNTDMSCASCGESLQVDTVMREELENLKMAVEKGKKKKKPKKKKKKVS